MGHPYTCSLAAYSLRASISNKETGYRILCQHVAEYKYLRKCAYTT